MVSDTFKLPAVEANLPIGGYLAATSYVSEERPTPDGLSPLT